MPAPVFTANSNYTIIDREPLVLVAGEAVKPGPSDRVWPGWLFVTNAAGCSTYVPDATVAMAADGTGRMLARFDATDLSVRKGDKIISLQENGGWHWCRNADGQTGWVPAYVLEPAGETARTGLRGPHPPKAKGTA